MILLFANGDDDKDQVKVEEMLLYDILTMLLRFNVSLSP